MIGRRQPIGHEGLRLLHQAGLLAIAGFVLYVITRVSIGVSPRGLVVALVSFVIVLASTKVFESLWLNKARASTVLSVIGLLALAWLFAIVLVNRLAT